MSTPAPLPSGTLPGPLASMANIFVDPAEAVRGIPRAWSWLWPLLISAAITTAIGYALVPATLRAMRLDPPRGMTAEQVEQSMGTIEMASRIGALSSPVTMSVMLAALAGILLLACSLAGILTSFRDLFSLLAYCSLIGTLQSAASFVVVRLKGDEIQSLEGLRPSFGLGLLLSEGSGKALRAMLDYFSVFTVWYIVALVVALAALTGVSRKKAFLLSIPVWLLPMLMVVGGFLLRG